MDERRPPKAEAAGSNPAGDAPGPELNGGKPENPPRALGLVPAALATRSQDAGPLGSTAPRSDWTDTRVLNEAVRVRIPPGPRHFWRRYVGIPRSFAEPRTDGYR